MYIYVFSGLLFCFNILIWGVFDGYIYEKIAFSVLSLIFLGGGQYSLLFDRYQRALSQCAYARTILESSCGAGRMIGYCVYDYETSREYISDSLRKSFELSAQEGELTTILPKMSMESAVALCALKERVEAQEKLSKDPIILHVDLTGEGHTQYWYCIVEVREELKYQNLSPRKIAVYWFYDETKNHSERMREQRIVEDCKKQISFLANIIQQLPIAIWMRRSSDCHITFCNITYQKWLESPEVTPALRHQLELFHGASQLSQRVLCDHRLGNERRHLLSEGKSYVFDVHEIPLSDGQQILGFMIDISEQDALSHQIADYQHRHSDILNISHVPMVLLNDDFLITHYNSAFISLFGVNLEWIRNKPHFGALLDNLYERNMLPQQHDYACFRQFQLDVLVHLTEPNSQFFYLPNGCALSIMMIPHTLGGILIAYEDISDRLTLERSYNVLLAAQRITLDHLQEGVVVIGEDGRVRLYNSQYVQMWHHPPELLDQKPYFSDLLERSKHLYHYTQEWLTNKKHLLSVIQQRSRVVRDRIERTDGRVIDRIYVPLPDGSSLLSYLDLTEFINVQKSLRRQNRLLEETKKAQLSFVVNVTCWLKIGFQSLLQDLDYLQRDLVNQWSMNSLDNLQQLNQRLVDWLYTVHDVSDVASLSVGHIVLQSVYNPLLYVVDLLHHHLQQVGSADAARIDLLCDVPSDILFCCDVSRLQSVFEKLMLHLTRRSILGAWFELQVTYNEPRSVVFCLQYKGLAPDAILANLSKVPDNKPYFLPPGLEAQSSLELSLAKYIVEIHNGKMHYVYCKYDEQLWYVEIPLDNQRYDEKTWQDEEE